MVNVVYTHTLGLKISFDCSVRANEKDFFCGHGIGHHFVPPLARLNVAAFHLDQDSIVFSDHNRGIFQPSLEVIPSDCVDTIRKSVQEVVKKINEMNCVGMSDTYIVYSLS